MTLLYPRLPNCAVEYATRKLVGGYFAACVRFLDKPNNGGAFYRSRSIYRREPFRTRSAARWHAEQRQREIVVRPDILRTYLTS